MSWFSRKKEEANRPKLHTDEKPKEKAMPASSAPRGGNPDSYQAVIGPHITEKASLMGQHGTYVFRVRSRANKEEIKKSIEALYNVGVSSVRIIRLPSKTRNVGRTIGVRPGFKKAVVTLKKGDKIDIIG